MKKPKEGKINNNINSVKLLARKIDGWLSDIEGEFLYNKAKVCTGKGVIVEIGSWKGKSTVWLGFGSNQGTKTKVYAIDPHNAGADLDVYGKVNTLSEFNKNIQKAKLNGIVIPIVKESMEAVKGWNKPIELLFVDGSHKYEFAKKDFLSWSKHLIEGGTIAFHDTLMFGGPRKVINEIILGSKKFREFRLVDSITSAEKVGSITLADKSKNFYFMVRKTIIGLKVKALFIKNHLMKNYFFLAYSAALLFNSIPVTFQPCSRQPSK
ncbi:MAG: class I SAM-dependent methyltransferase [Candidatus Diapherotrites archaeon]